MTSRLGRLQEDFLAAFFRLDQRFFLTGGAALAGFHLFHRETQDLDLFVLEDVLDEGVAEIVALAANLGATTESILTSPDFRRLLLRREDEAVLIDLVRERVRQMISQKPVIRGIRVDPPQEILANKLCALLARAEIRDLVDLRALESVGYRIEDVIQAAAAKDASLTPGQLSWVLSQIRLGPDLVPPGGVSRSELLEYLEGLIDRLARLAFPPHEP
jgi:hypothetical protein